MKKIIALAVASAFVTPVMAAEVALTGDVEFAFKSSGDNMDFVNGDRDFKIVGSEEIGGLAVTAVLDIEDGDMANGTPDTYLKISGAFGALEIGSGAGSAAGDYDEVADVAEQGAGTVLDDGFSQTGSIVVSPNLGVEGLSVSVGYSVKNSVSSSSSFTAVATGTAVNSNGFATRAAAASTDSVSYGIQYSIAGVKIAHGSEKEDGAALRTSVTSLSGTFGPVYVAYELLSNNEQDDAEDWTNVGATYNYGMGKVYYEQNKKDNGKSIAAFGVSYKVGSTLNTYVGVEDDDSKSDTSTFVGVEYSF